MAVPLIAEFKKGYPTGVCVRAHFSVPNEPGSIAVFFGPSGAGKTTVLRVLAGLERPDSGEVRLGQQRWIDTSANIFLSPKDRRVGMVSQHISLFPHMNVAKNVAYGLRRLDAHTTRQRVAEVLSVVGLGGYEQRKVSELSGGQARRVELARALAPRPRLLLLDEPFTGLDTQTRHRLAKDLRTILAASTSAAIVVTHDRDEALMIGDWMVVFADGSTPQAGPIEEVLSSPASLEVARALGFETILAARIVRREKGIAVLEIEGRFLVAADPGLDEENVFVVIRAEDIALREPSRDTAKTRAESSRNHLPATVVAFERKGALYRVTLDAGFHLHASVTSQAIEELALREGAEVEAAIKAAAVRCVPRSKA